ncbi:MAG: tRNA threonylcarbamoyladenosine dehydratase [bacterium]|nr:tRNA threonylcarbamoyladenosine dehydratase [bacterium]
MFSRRGRRTHHTQCGARVRVGGVEGMWLDRTRELVGDDGIRALQAAHVTVMGLGGVGSFAAEAIARAGIGHITVVDADAVKTSNLNRQLYALKDTLGRPKAEVALERISGINPDATVTAHAEFVGPEDIETVVGRDTPFVIDAIDSLNPKVNLLRHLCGSEARFVSCMGAGRRMDPLGVAVDDIADTQGCPLAKRVRRRLRRVGVESGVRCVYFPEPGPPIPYLEPSENPLDRGRRRVVQASNSFVPGIVGLTAAGIIINDIVAGA